MYYAYFFSFQSNYLEFLRIPVFLYYCLCALPKTHLYVPSNGLRPPPIKNKNKPNQLC